MLSYYFQWEQNLKKKKTTLFLSFKIKMIYFIYLLNKIKNK